MLIEKTLKDTLADYIKGKPVTVCMFRATGNTKGAGCSYIEITGHSRGCSVEECSVYQKGDAVSKRKMKGFYE